MTSEPSIYSLMQQRAALKARYERGDFDADMQRQDDELREKIDRALKAKRAK